MIHETQKAPSGSVMQSGHKSAPRHGKTASSSAHFSVIQETLSEELPRTWGKATGKKNHAEDCRNTVRTREVANLMGPRGTQTQKALYQQSLTSTGEGVTRECKVYTESEIFLNSTQREARPCSLHGNSIGGSTWIHEPRTLLPQGSSSMDIFSQLPNNTVNK